MEVCSLPQLSIPLPLEHHAIQYHSNVFRISPESPESPNVPTLTLLGVSRCFPFWQEYLACYVVNQNEDSRETKTCVPVLEDYYECLHHKKEVLPTSLTRLN
jgi:hypothetical protein